MPVSDVPPGLDPVSSIKVIAAGGDSRWLPYAGKAIFSNVVPVDEREGKILLAFRVNGFGRNKYNPFSGPIQPGSNPVKAANRDLQAQCGLQAVDISKLGKLIVVLEGNSIALDIDVFRATSWRGEAVDTVEVRPRWFSSATALSSGSPKLSAVPWDQMFEDNKFWIPLLTEGKFFIGRIDFGAPSPGEDVGPLLRYWFATV
ncbi:hypothetical protein FRB90_009659 [Tulasnella sp. 427]|nr:hypothetical protein FRB90_009659 [Tulasnella sp. 427]